MRSDTLTPLAQWLEWWGIDPWRASGIDKTGITDPSAGAYQVTNKTRCICMYEFTWMSGDDWSREDLRDLLVMAENMFIDEVRAYPSDYQILQERIQYPIESIRGPAMRKLSGQLKTVRPNWPCNIINLGVVDLQLLGNIALNRLDGLGNLMDYFTLTFPVPVGTLERDIRVFFTQADSQLHPEGGYNVPPQFNDHLWEVRPLTIEIDAAWNATVTGPAYLFKHPRWDYVYDDDNDPVTYPNQTTAGCLLHVPDTYVDTVDVYLEVADYCRHGEFVCPPVFGCNTPACEETRFTFCANTKMVGLQQWLTLTPAECQLEDDGTGNFVNVLRPIACISCYPTEVELNYLTGIEKIPGGELDRVSFDIIALLAIGLMDCIKDWCDCDYCASRKIDYYRSIPKFKDVEDRRGQQQHASYSSLVSKKWLEILNGLDPYRAFGIAFRKINQIRCTATEGANR